jgi:ubiquitin thioesterase protein OTUB1
MRIGDKQKFTIEEVRLKSMQNLLREIGFQEHLYEDFVEETLEMLQEASSATDNGVGLLAAFNDFSRSQSIITYLKVRTTDIGDLNSKPVLAFNKCLDSKVSRRLRSIYGIASKGLCEASH